MIIPPKPAARPRRTTLWRYARAFRRDILSAQPAHLFSARMAEFRTPFFRSYLVNEPELIAEILKARPRDFPKSARVTEGLRPLLGEAVFVTNGDTWERQRRIIDPAFDAARLGTVFPALVAAAEAAAARLPQGASDIEGWASHATADAIFRVLFSIPIEDHLAQATYDAFRAYQRAQPILNLGAFLPLRKGWPRFHRRTTRAAAQKICALIMDLVARRLAEVRAGRAPDDLATRLLSARDPETGQGFDPREMVDQVAIFFLAGHETSAAALSWALYLLALDQETQKQAADEARDFMSDPAMARLSSLSTLRNVFRETLRLYPPVPMMVRETSQDEHFRKRTQRQGAQIVISPWHLHRSPRHWNNPDAFDPKRWEGERGEAYLPFSTGPRVCPGASLAMAEGAVFLAAVLSKWRILPVHAAPPVPSAHLTLRSKAGTIIYASPRIWGRDAT